jgi:hypothetical protein
MARPVNSGPGGGRPDGRRQLLIYMKPDIIKALKRAALDDDVNAYELAEEAIEAYLKTRKSKKS